METANCADTGRPSFFSRLEWLLLIAALALVILVYPFRLRDELLFELATWWNRRPTGLGGWTKSQLEAWLYFFYSPLILKGSLAGYALVGFLVVRFSRWLFSPEGTIPAAHSATGGRAWLGVACFFGWTVASAFWSPTPAISQAGALWAGLYGLLFYVALRRGFSLRELEKLAWLLMLLGFIAIWWLFALQSPLLLGRWLANPFDAQPDIRNMMGTLLGHNTAAASFLMMTSFPALALVLTDPLRWRRWLAGAYLILLAPVLLLMQSRSIWVLAPILGLLAVRSSVRALGWRRLKWLPTLILALLSLGLISQIIEHPANPFFVRENPFVRRLHDLTPEGLLEESRLRLNRIGITLVPDAPLIGHGLYSFQYVYPRRQGEFFNARPDSRLNRTLYRSHMAHNEYLQVLIEEGAIGLGLLAWMLIQLARAGMRARRELTDSRHRLLHSAFGWSSLGFVLHALFDFPFHVPQLALPGLFCLIAWAAARAVPDPLDSAGAAALGLESSEAGSPSFRPRIFMKLLLAMIAIVGLPFFLLPWAIAMRSDVLMNKGNGYILSFYAMQQQMSPTEKVECLKNAVKSLDESRRLLPSNAMADLRLSEAYLTLATLYVQSAANDKSSAEHRGNQAEIASRLLDNALEAVDRASRGLAYHLIAYRRAVIHRRLATLYPQSDHRLQERKYLEETLLYVPHFGEALHELAELLAEDPASDPARIRKLRSDLLRFQHYLFDDYYVYPATRLNRQFRYRSAIEIWRTVLDVNPGNSEWAANAATAFLTVGDREEARRILDAARKLDASRFITSGADLIYASLDQRYLHMLFDLTLMRGADARQTARFRAIEMELDRRLDRVGYPTRFPLPAGLQSSEYEHLIAEARPFVLWTLFNDPTAARMAFDEYRQAVGKPTLEYLIQGVYLARARHDESLARELLAEIRERDPQNPALPELETAS